MNELLQFIDEQDKWLRNKYPNVGKVEQAYGRMTKIAEETGELASAIGCAVGRQREEKLAKFDVDELGMEMADVVFTVFLLAKTMDVDMQKAILAKMQKVRARQK